MSNSRPSVFKVFVYLLVLCCVHLGYASTTLEPASEPTLAAQAEGSSEPESGVSSEPQSESTSEPESEITSEPQAEVTLDPQSEVSSDPQSEVSSEPQSEVTPEPQSEVSSEPQSDVTPEPQSEVSSEPQSEVTSEPQSEVTSEPQSKGTSEPQAEVTPEPESEVTSDPQSEFSSEPQSEVSSEPQSEVTSEPQSEVTSEPQSEGTSEPQSEGTSEPESEVKPEQQSESTSEPESEVISEPQPEVTSEPQAEGTSETESEVTTEQQSESTSEPESEVTSGPQAEGISEPGLEATSEPQAEGTSESEAEVTPEPQAEGTSEPESEVTSEPQSEVTSEPQAEVTSEPQAEVTPEPQAEGTSEPESEVSSAPQSEGTSEPESEVTPESQAEGTSEPESEVTSEPQAEGTSEPGSEVTSEPQVEGTSEPESEVTSESEEEITSEPKTGSEVEAEAEIRPSAAEIILPPFGLMFMIIIGLLVLLGCSRYRYYLTGLWRRVRPETSYINNNDSLEVQEIQSISSNDTDGDVFLTPFDLEVMASLHTFYNRPREIIKISLPALISLALCPLTLYMYQPFTSFLWPSDQFDAIPDINDAIACFLAPAGLVYATSFGFAFQQALGKQHHILNKVTQEISMVDQIATFATKLKLKNYDIRREIYRATKAEAIFMILQVVNREQDSYINKCNSDIKVRIWSVVDLIREADNEDYVSRVMCEKILTHIMKLNSICSDRMGILHTSIHPVKWVFLESLGFFSFIGILLLKAFSYRMELVMCIITVFSISLLCYVVSDLDSPFSGFFRVELSVLGKVIHRLENMYYNEPREPWNTNNDVDTSFDSSVTTSTVVHENSDIRKSLFASLFRSRKAKSDNNGIGKSMTNGNQYMT